MAFFYSDYTQQLWHLPEETLFSHFMTTLNDTFSTELTQEDKGYESVNESFNVPPFSAEHCESTMSPWWEIYPSILQTLDDHQQLQSSMQSPHLTDTEVAASPPAN